MILYNNWKFYNIFYTEYGIISFIRNTEFTNRCYTVNCTVDRTVDRTHNTEFLFHVARFMFLLLLYYIQHCCCYSFFTRSICTSRAFSVAL
jgi:hypothetical protein